MSGLEIRWPDASGERVRAAQGRLTRAGEALRARSLTDRIAAVARVLDDWTKPDSPWRRELLESFAQTSRFDRGTIAEGLESALRAWHPARLRAAAERELACVLPDSDGSAPRLALAPFDWTAVLAGGTIPMPTLLTSLLPLVLGFAHQSNGRTQPLSRSWNRVYANFVFEYEDLYFSVKPWYRIPERDKTDPLDARGDDNPDIHRYLGYGEMVDRIERDTVVKFLERVPQYEDKLGSYEQDGNTKLLSAVERLAIEAATVG